MNTNICKTCGKPLTGGQKEYCSRACSNKRGIISIVRICKTCGKEFRIYPSQSSRYDDYCSLKCSPRYIENKVKVCEYCGKEFVCISNRQVKTRRFCSHKCAYDYSNSSTVVFCDICGEPISTFPSYAARFKRHFCSKNCQSIGQSGSGNPSWKGGSGSYRGPNWWKQRKKARERDGFICQNCGITEEEIGQSLDVHHIKPFRLFDNYKDANQLDNLTCLCHTCHLEKDRILNNL